MDLTLLEFELNAEEREFIERSFNINNHYTAYEIGFHSWWTMFEESDRKFSIQVISIYPLVKESGMCN